MRVLVAEAEDEEGQVGGVLLGLGVRHLARAASGAEAQARCEAEAFDLLLCAVDLPDTDGFALVRWLRRSTTTNQKTPVIMTASRTTLSSVTGARDCGANFIIPQPVQPSVLLRRMEWLSRDARPFVVSEAYVGPERRFKAMFPNAGRRAGDAEPVDPELVGVELAQDGVDALFA